jgi:hypothetical protein
VSTGCQDVLRKRAWASPRAGARPCFRRGLTCGAVHGGIKRREVVEGSLNELLDAPYDTGN